MPSADLSRDEARGIALAATGFDQRRPKRVTAATLSRTIRRMAVLQLDFVNVLLPAHYLMLYSRLGPYRRELLDELVYVRHEFTESWAREAAVIPVETWPLLEHRRAAHETARPSLKPFLTGRDRPRRSTDASAIEDGSPRTASATSRAGSTWSSGAASSSWRRRASRS